MECVNISASTSPHIKQRATIGVNEGRRALSLGWEEWGSWSAGEELMAAAPCRGMSGPLTWEFKLEFESVQC